MLAKLKMKLESDNFIITQSQASIFHGILMQTISSEYAEYLHNQGLKPYSQSIQREDNQIYWYINTLNKEAYDNIIVPMNTIGFEQFHLDKKAVDVRIMSKTVSTMSKESLFEQFYDDLKARNYITIIFQSPTSFKSNGEYCIMPDLKLIYQSLMNKYSTVDSDVDMRDEETLTQLVLNSKIVSYNLKSVFFPLEGIKIPSFKGEITIKIKGSTTMARYIHFLAQFSEYSGVGIKTGIGMGAMKIR